MRSVVQPNAAAAAEQRDAHRSTQSVLNSPAGGFTLIEILVVVVILAVLSVAVILSTASIGGERQLAHQADRAQALLAYACEQAELTGREIGISLNRDGYRFSRLDRNDWVPIIKDELRSRHWLRGTRLRLSRDGRTVRIAGEFPEKPQLVCFSSGELTAFELLIGLHGVTRQYRLQGQPDGDVKLAVVELHAQP